ncbi:carboxymethylenebutenolidase [Rhizocola hellebori]|uniref:Carboxymethylenebutenolidase n=1 Tax=Rhizocola hellebori TaxID=1392758 RepID=A0A8J3VHS5_9ACTN|nr:dienelactone hydrolase family protein [Rhizocola hellebori]GIH06805.1 carboxymethylenebutenolidase [Rhizocola hellebori]
MNEINRYLTEEVVVDYADGLISRREALHRLGLLGVAAAVATPLLAACDADRPAETAPTATAPATPQLGQTEAITFAGQEGRTLQGSFAAADTPRGAVLIIHENRGLTDHFVALPARLARSGFSALAVDLLSAEGGTAKFTDPAQATAALNAAPPARFIADMRSGLDELEKRVPRKKAAAMGFCFGGGQVWSLLAAGEPRLYAAAPFYGPAPADADFSKSPNAKVLGIYAQLDDRINATREPANAALQKAGLTHEMVTYPSANHAFFNETGPRYLPEAAAQAYQKVLEWFGRYLA